MKIRLFPLLIAAFAAFLSCENEIVIGVDEVDPYIIMNAQLHTDDSTHSIILTIGRRDGTDPCSGADVKVFLNDNAAIRAVEVEMEEMYEKSVYMFDAEIRPGDRVRIEARVGSMLAKADVTAPEAPVIEGVDFSVKDNPAAEDPDNRSYYVLKTKIKDLQGKSYYRCKIGAEYEAVTQTSSRMLYTDMNILDQSAEPLLTAGWASGDEDFNLSNIFSPENSYSIFTDDSFEDGEYTLNLRAPVVWVNSPWFNDPDYVISDSVLMKPTAVIKLYSMSFLQYRYIISLYNYDLFGYEVSIIAEPVSLPSNVEGGLGFVSVESYSEYKVPLPEFELGGRYY